jgi:Raf kinase inhibitor-like YbhB/YbcL family protein
MRARARLGPGAPNTVEGAAATLCLIVLACALPLAAQQATGAPARPNVVPPLKITIPAFADGGVIPIPYTCSASTPPPGGPMQISLGLSPAIQWSDVPPGTVSFALILHDGDAHIRKAVDDIPHWVIFDIPGDSTSLPEGIPPDAPLLNGTKQGNNMMGRAAYQGPCAPPGLPHHYIFELYALDKKLELAQGASREEVVKAMEGHVSSGAVYIGLFHR